MQFDQYLNDYINSFECDLDIKQAIKYVFNNKGKLIRPSLFWAMLSDLDISEKYFEIALAIEFIHTYSLVHDDLPAIDDDDYRRGQLSCHKVYGEDIAILTGDALLTQAFDLITKSNLDSERQIEIIKKFTAACGINGMIDGQVLDVKNENNRHLTIEQLKKIHHKKTALMIELPIYCAQLIGNKVDLKATAGALDLGVFYQIQDDYLDRYGDFTKMGKKTNADIFKVTYSTLYNQKQLEALINSLSKQIISSFQLYPKTSELINLIIKREG